MQLNFPTLALAAGLASNVQAAAIVSPRNDSNPTLMYSRAVEAGSLQYWGSASEQPVMFDWEAAWTNPASWPPVPLSDAPTVNQQCGNDDVFCSEVNLAPTDLCEKMIDILIRNRGVDIPSGVNGLSLTSGRWVCYMAWRSSVDNMRQGYLINAAEATLRKCGANGAVSGWAETVNLNNACTSQCLSNRFDCR
ncbi:hypothetical protein CORC01_00883 [Colletotrichum orchidophilum]|uniref:WD-like domain-containing protein n=1 Tax=Colletotrichum orchidophilum TaxID=1209926 RepID=A0A1G4BRK2_9PEZI|nr:uncharacterized protein CORC01_00883 [Colletotrichum orchidophilum]OHF04021.1 hypothetical protein CORC01_00883 [Colletotrichum orchidophilum]